MVTLTTEEAINMIRNLSQVEGALLAMNDNASSSVQDCLDYSVEILIEKLKEELKGE